MIYNLFVSVIDGPDACGKSTVISELNKNLYHKVPGGPISDIHFFSIRPATRLETVDKDKTNEYENNMYEYMDAFLLGRIHNIKRRSDRCNEQSRRFLPRTIRKPDIEIHDRGLLSTFFYAYVHDDGGYDYAKMIKELNGAKHTSKSKKSENTVVSAITREAIVDRLVARYIKFESVIRDRIKILLNSSEDKEIQYRNNCEECYYDGTESMYTETTVCIDTRGIDVGALTEALHTDITIAVCCAEELSDKVIERKHIIRNDDNRYEQVFETNEVFRKNTNLIYNFFMNYCLPKLDDMNYVNPFIGHIIKVYTSQTINGETEWKKPINSNRDIVTWWNHYLSANNLTTLGYRGHEQYRFQTSSTWPDEEVY